jgi:hypothetical protein
VVFFINFVIGNHLELNQKKTKQQKMFSNWTIEKAARVHDNVTSYARMINMPVVLEHQHSGVHVAVIIGVFAILFLLLFLMRKLFRSQK